MFWRFGGYANISTLDTILDKPDVTLEELLDESDLIQELKAQNAKLIEFLRDESVLDRLLKYVISPPTAKGAIETEVGSAEKRSGGGLFSRPARNNARSKSRSMDGAEGEKHEKQRLKYAFVACEILSSEVWSISESLLECQDHLRTFWEYMKSDAPLDPLQAGYFTKVNESLLEKKTEEMIAFIKTLDNVVPNMMKHVDCPMVMDLLLKLISLEKDRGGQGIVDWLQEQNLIPTLLSYITADHSAATQTSAGDFLKAIITISANATGQDTSVIGPNELTRQLVSDSCVENLNGQMLKGGSPLTVGVGIIIEVIRKNNSDYDQEAPGGPDPKTSDPIYLGSLLRIFAKHIPNFMELILSRRHSIMTESGSKTIERQDLKVAWGDKIEPLGFDRFKTCELMAELLHCSNMGLLNERGSETEVRKRDAAREKLRAEGKLASTEPERAPATDFGTSVASSGFHHDEEYVSLSESPNGPKDIQSGGDEDGFEKVGMSDLQDLNEKAELEDSPPPSDLEMPQVHLKEVSSCDSGDLSDDEALSPVLPHEITSQLANMSLKGDALESSIPVAVAREEEVTPLSEKEPPQMSDQAEGGLEPNELTAADKDEESIQEANIPAPLFSSNPFSQPGHESDLNSEDRNNLAEGPSKEAESATVGSDLSRLPIMETEEDGLPVVGDLLKIMFVENKVVPIILDFFFRFPWNNFLHNVVYDVVQQVFNGAMDRGYNRKLAIDLFETGRITERIIEGQQRSAALEKSKNMRLGYMGHLTLIAEEVVKFTERQPADLLDQSVVAKVTHPDWINYVEHILADTRERDNAILGGVRPDAIGGPRQAVLNAVNAAQGAFGTNNSTAMADTGLTDNSTAPGLDSMDLANAGHTEYGSNALISGFGNSSDEDEEDVEEVEAGEQTTTSAAQQEGYDEEQHPSSSPADKKDTLSELISLASTSPSIARRRFEARLAERRSLEESAPVPSRDGAHEDLTNFDSVFPSVGQTTTAVSTSPAQGAFGRYVSEGIDVNPWNPSNTKTVHGLKTEQTPSTSGGFSSTFRGFEYGDGNDDEEPGVSLEEYVEGDGEADLDVEEGDPGLAGLERQTTSEALERRPLDSDDEDNDDPDPPTTTVTNEPAPAKHSPQHHPRRTHSGEGASSFSPHVARTTSSISPPASPEEEDPRVGTSHGTIRARLAKLREQERVRNFWGLPGGAPSDVETMAAAQIRYEEEDDGDDEDDDDDDDEDGSVIEIGAKYLRRGSRSSTGSTGSA